MFQVGDRVRFQHRNPAVDDYNGMLGTVCKVRYRRLLNEEGVDHYRILFDNNELGLTFPEELTLVEEEKMSDTYVRIRDYH